MPSPAHDAPDVFGLLDWSVIAIYLLFTTILGAALSGKQTTIREFFLGGRRLPWWAICGSIIATEISATSFIAVPALSYAPGGNLTYLQLGIGAIIARFIIGLVLVPRYYEQEIYSPYDYMGSRLGPRVKSMTTLIFFVGGVLGQGVRVYVTAFILSTVAKIDFLTSIWAIGAFAVAWTLLGGITTVIWTDVIQFGILILGAIIALIYSVSAVEGGANEVAHLAEAAGKFQLIDSSNDLTKGFTLLAGVLAMPFLNLAALGIDQVMAQRMFCCKNQKQATTAIIASCVGQLIAVLMLLVGVALYAYYQHHPLLPDAAAEVSKEPTYIFPYFIARRIPAGVRAIIVAAILAASISSLDSALAALSQTTIGAFKEQILKIARRIGVVRGRAPSDIALSKGLVVAWGVVLCVMASACILIRDQYASVIELVLSLVAYTYGPLLGIFLLAMVSKTRNDAGLPWAAAMAVLAVFALNVHSVISAGEWFGGSAVTIPWADWVVWSGCATVLGASLFKYRDDLSRIGASIVVVFLILLVHHWQIRIVDGRPLYLHPYWGYPLGTLITFFVGWHFAERGRKVPATGRARRKLR